jgi:hypothetical protein
MNGGIPKTAGVRLYDDELPPSLKIVPTVYPMSPPIDETAHQFWNAGEGFASVAVRVVPPAKPLELLEKLGPSPFERGEFPLVGFLATTYEKVSRFALSRRPGGDNRGEGGGGH